MKLAIMQPYFMPYLGYFQLMYAVDKFVLYDDIQFTKKGWINRNRICMNGKSNIFSVPLKNDSDFLNINQRYLADEKDLAIQKILRQIKSAYVKAPYFKDVFPLLERIFLNKKKNLFDFIYASIIIVREYLAITCELIISSQLKLNDLKGQDKVIEICKELGAVHYFNPIGGIGLYDRAVFKDNGITLHFLEMKLLEYDSINQFIPSLSIIDVLMFNSKEETKELLKAYSLF